MALGNWKLDLGKEVALADVPAQLGKGAYTILRVDTAAGKTTVHFSGDGDDVAKALPQAVAAKLEDIAKP